ncbi:uncharacterized protein LOC112041502 [Lingula anatina]|uniref:Uncharacterized protein LOC112041502 n=1 Tax=Lingula anatina TaxID=7574 RepID=A0A2R2MK67_LINAN|nr:uncharacterized protein LOC112041502 [Lingula anatina]|eukprot:XP_023930616.1 uncharacterized protein LOC112041502 [Lingula anatina]
MVEPSSSRTVQGELTSAEDHVETRPASQPVSAALIAVSVVSVVIIIALVLLVVVIVKKRNAPQNSLPTNPHLNPAFDNNGNDKPERHLSSSPHQGDTSHYEGLTPAMPNISSKDEHPYQQITGNPVYEIPTFTVYENGANDYQPILPSTREENV